MAHSKPHPRPHRLITTLAVIFVFVIGLVGLAAVVGLNWIGTYFVPVMVILGVVLVCLSLLVWVVKRLPDPPYRDRQQ